MRKLVVFLTLSLLLSFTAFAGTFRANLESTGSANNATAVNITWAVNGVTTVTNNVSVLATFNQQVLTVADGDTVTCTVTFIKGNESKSASVDIIATGQNPVSVLGTPAFTVQQLD